jgi:hypothetical protein
VSELPDRPSLDHLRKQAKALLKTLRQQNPEAALTEAQHALAGDYGFASWPKLKDYVEQRAARSESPIFPRLTSKARESLFFAWHEANHFRSGRIEPGHLLLGLIRAGTGLKGRMFEPPAVPLDRARAAMATRLTTEVPVPPDRHMVLSPRTHRVLHAAVEEADAHHHQGVGLAHLVLGVLREGDAPATALLDQMGIGMEQVRAGLDTYLHEEMA